MFDYGRENRNDTTAGYLKPIFIIYTHKKNIIPDVHSYTGTEGISQPSLERNSCYKMELME